MKLTVITLWHDPEKGFDTEPLNQFCETHDVRAWVEHFFTNDGRPELAVVLQYEDRLSKRSAGRFTKTERDPRRDLPAAVRPVYDRLREWRSLRSRSDGVPVYVVFSNRELAAIAMARPDSKEALRAIEGIGRAKADRYAEEVFTVLASLSGPDSIDDQEGKENV